MDRLQAIQSFIDTRKFKTYLEIGVLGGFNFFKVKCAMKIAVDPEFRFNWKGRLGETFRNADNFNAVFSETTSDAFFENEAPGIFAKKSLDLCLVDGMHEFGFALRDVDNALDYLSDDGVIVMHDCNPATREAEGTFEEWKKRGHSGYWNGDVWKVVHYLRQYRRDVEVFVADCDHGLGIITKTGLPINAVDLRKEDEIRKLTYDDLEQNREQLLNLKPVAYLEEFISRKLPVGHSRS